MRIYAAMIEHKYGTEIFLKRTEEDLNRALADYVDMWKEEVDPEIEEAIDKHLSDENYPAAIDAYFDDNEMEFLTRYEPRDV